jgi:hypothetical protein
MVSGTRSNGRDRHAHGHHDWMVVSSSNRRLHRSSAQLNMKRYLQFYLTVILAVVLFDVVAAFASRIFLFDYTRLFWVSSCIYLIAGFVGCNRLGFVGGIGAGLVAGFGDATLGWFLSNLIGPYVPHQLQPYGILVIAITIVIVSTLGTLFGLIGAIFSKVLIRGRSSTAADQVLGSDSP